jgi:hypothetical protein
LSDFARLKVVVEVEKQVRESLRRNGCNQQRKSASFITLAWDGTVMKTSDSPRKLLFSKWKVPTTPRQRIGRQND